MSFSVPSRVRILSFWVLFPALFLGISLFVSSFGLFGSWTVTAFGVPYYYNWDPDGFYLGVGLTFFDQRYTWVGHPGIPLVALIYTVARACHGIGMALGDSAPFESFAAKQAATVILASKIAVSLFHILSFAMLYRIGRIFLTKQAARIAVLAYATSAIVLYYMNKISPEPLWVFFALLSLFALWKYVETHRSRQKYLFLALAAFAAMAAVTTKIMIAFPLVFFVPLYILGHGEMTQRDKRVGIALFFLFSSLFFATLGWKVDWIGFITFWLQYSPTQAPSGNVSPEIHPLFAFIRFLIHLSVSLAEGFLSFLKLDPSDQKGQFNLAELPFFILSAGGFLLYWKKNPQKRRQAAWLAVFAVMMAPGVLYKGAHHYLPLHLALAALFCGYFVWETLSRLIIKAGSERTKTLAAVFSVLLIHAYSLALFVETKKSDMTNYLRDWRPYYRALAAIDDSQQIGILKVPEKTEIPGRLLSYYLPPASQIGERFRSFFVYLPGDTLPENLGERRIGAVLLHDPEGVRRIWPADPKGLSGR